ncbi:hypothetical protein D910_07851 [Dendroctonus ponderosae]|uniref:Uncharacterized protein n=1 Tax=Dendroctonus ponderosae TaxID=77166 RepID=U4UDX0_DENPD|nr:hypothetical protein D910_00551 [Dendroctonus ponderosae]ERL90503.1 hypothetical protein D910_07851 [Dendroctonus ponderosae]
MVVMHTIRTGDEIHGSKTVNREIGYHISRLEKYDKSLEYFDKAVKENPDDRRTLIGRSTARAKAAQYGGAMEDIGHVLSIDPDDLTAWSVSTRNIPCRPEHKGIFALSGEQS